MNKKSLILQVILAALSFAVYFNTIPGSFVFDDFLHIVENKNIQSLEGIKETFKSPLPPGNLYRPVLITSYAINYYFSGLNSPAFHLTNILLHALIVLLIFNIFRLYFNELAAFVTAAIFCVHPTPSEAVANISGRSELLVHFFGLLFLFLGLCFTRKKYFISLGFNFIAAGACFALAIFSKESALIYLILLPVCVYFLEEKLKKVLPVLVLASSCSLLYFILRFRAIGGLGIGQIDFIDNPLIVLPWPERIFNALYLLVQYLVLIIFPYRQSADYSFRQFSPMGINFQTVSIISLLVIALMLAAALKGFRQKNLLSFLVVWFFTSFLITGNVFFPIGTAFADRLTYLAAPAVIAALFLKLPKSALIPFGFLYFVTCASITVLHNKAWNNNLSLWTHQMQVAPNSVKVWGNYGAALMERERYEEAEIALRYAIKEYQEGQGAYRLLAELYSRQGKKEEAEVYYLKALEINPDDPITIEHYKIFKSR